MYEKEVNLDKVLNLVWSECLSLYSFLDDEFEEIDYEKRFEESKRILNQNGIIFIGMGSIYDGAEDGEKGTFYIDGFDFSKSVTLKFEKCWDEDIWEGKSYKNGGLGVFVKKIGDKYYCEYGISQIEGGVVCFAGYSIDFNYFGGVFEDDEIGLLIKNYLDNLVLI